jgi:FAD/FMN-containing dehydrogenase
MTQLNAPDPALLSDLKALLGPTGWRAPEDDDRYFSEPRGRWRGRAALVLRPDRVETVAEILRRASAAGAPVVPYGGGTGLVGGQLTDEGPPPLVLSLERMTAIRRVDAAENAMIVEAGAVLADVRRAAEAVDRLFPLSLASEGTARIGGLLSTNAGGVNVLRYGNARDLVLGIEAALPDGTILRGLKTLRKDNTGYDLRHLLIGAEGTLGVITAAALRLFPRPREIATAFCAIPGPEAAGALLALLRDRLGETVSACELLCAEGMRMLAEHTPDCPPPPVSGDWFALVEAGGGAGSHIATALEEALADAFERGLVEDAALAQSEAQRAAFWRIREDTPEANRRRGAVVATDVSVPLAAIAEMIARGREALDTVDPSLRVNCFGHVGDGNLHYNVFPPLGAEVSDCEALRTPAKDAIHEVVHALGGSVSAEHGLGRFKAGDLIRYGDPGKVAAMRAIKAALDPAGIMNPGVVLPPDS